DRVGSVGVLRHGVALEEGEQCQGAEAATGAEQEVATRGGGLVMRPAGKEGGGVHRGGPSPQSTYRNSLAPSRAWQRAARAGGRGPSLAPVPEGSERRTASWVSRNFRPRATSSSVGQRPHAAR